MEREEANTLIDRLIASSIEMDHMVANRASDSEFYAKKRERDDLWDQLNDALCKEPATESGDCELALEAEQKLLIWIEKQIDEQGRARAIIDLTLEGLTGFHETTAAVIAKMKEFIALQ